jgi:hypothetical protein
MDVTENFCVQVLRMQGVGRSSRGNLKNVGLVGWRIGGENIAAVRRPAAGRNEGRHSTQACEGVLRQVRLAEEEDPPEQRR